MAGGVGMQELGHSWDRRAEMAEPCSQGPVLKGGREVWRGPGGDGCNRGLEGLTARALHVPRPATHSRQRLPGSALGRLGCSAGGINTGVRPGV